MKVALCFIISYEHILNKEQLWIDWIKPNQDIINVYFHYKHKVLFLITNLNLKLKSSINLWICKV